MNNSSRNEHQRPTQSAQSQSTNSSDINNGEEIWQTSGGFGEQQQGLPHLGSHLQQAGYQQPYAQSAYSPYDNSYRGLQAASTFNNNNPAGASTSASSPTAAVLPNTSGYLAPSGSSLPYHFDYQHYTNRAGNPYPHTYHYSSYLPPLPSHTYAYSQPPYHSLPQSSSGSLATYNNPYPAYPAPGALGYSYNSLEDLSGPSTSRATAPEQKNPSYYENPTDSWEDFQKEWRRFIDADELDLYIKAGRGDLLDYTAPIMAAKPPTYEDCEVSASTLWLTTR
jgi:hypothetical protein